MTRRLRVMVARPAASSSWWVTPGRARWPTRLVQLGRGVAQVPRRPGVGWHECPEAARCQVPPRGAVEPLAIAVLGVGEGGDQPVRRRVLVWHDASPKPTRVSDPTGRSCSPTSRDRTSARHGSWVPAPMRVVVAADTAVPAWLALHRHARCVGLQDVMGRMPREPTGCTSAAGRRVRRCSPARPAPRAGAGRAGRRWLSRPGRRLAALGRSARPPAGRAAGTTFRR